MRTVDSNAKLPQLEEEVLSFWEHNEIFNKQNLRRQNSKEFSFYDGPPFANGLPHYGHLLANTIKDTVTRYFLMAGYKVDRRFGWDCHGLPVEFEIEKKLELKGRPDILKMGVSEFNETCRESVLHYASEWKKTITRLGRWVDWDNQYRTMDCDFMESVWWVFAELYKKGLVYRDFKVVPYSPRTTSVVSNFEANQNYKDVQDPAITVKFKAENEDFFFLVWTTTPWTLPANLALAVGKEISYVLVKDKASGERWLLAEPRLSSVFKSTDDYEIVKSYKAQELKGKSYEPLFPYYKGHAKSFCVLVADYVTAEDGTGIVHQAPAFGEDDFFACKEIGIELVDPIDEVGCFTAAVPEYQGQYFKDADKNIIRDLKKKNLIIKHDTIVHSYPFDERTDTPLMYKAVPSWYVAVSRFVDKLVANNRKINWVPHHLKEGRMGTWLANARDWSISRNRFWGTPLPVWECDENPEHLEIFGSVESLEKRSESKITDIHKHYTQNIHFSCQKCQGKMKNVDVVFDCWFESGSMPYAQLHYPFSYQGNFKDVFPADFVAEGLDQTRGWFYTLTVLSTALFDEPAFKNVIVNGVILDETGKKMSKRHRNYTPPMDLIANFGADSVRLYMLHSPLLRAEDLIFVNDGVKEITRQVILPLWNAYSFLSTYATADNWQPEEALLKDAYPHSENELDQWIVSRLQGLYKSVSTYMHEYKLYLVVPEIIDFIDDLTNWYIRLNRRRFWGDSDSSEKTLTEEQKSAYSTLYYVLLHFTKLFASFAPFISDIIFRNLTDGLKTEESVHLTDIHKGIEKLCRPDLDKRMQLLKLTISHGRSLRQKHQIKTRQVLPDITVICRNTEDGQAIKESALFIKQELNVKQVFFTTEEEKYVELSLKPNLKTLGRKLGARLNELRSFLENLSPKEVSVLLQQLEEDGKILLIGTELFIDDFLVERKAKEGKLIATGGGVSILLNISLTDELVREGLAREIVNRIQTLRKDSGLDVSDRICLQMIAGEKLLLAINENKDYIAKETLALDIDCQKSGNDLTYKFVQSYQIDTMALAIGLERAKH